MALAVRFSAAAGRSARPMHRRAAFALLQEASGGGAFILPDGDLLLPEAPMPAADRAATLLEQLLTPTDLAVLMQRWPLPASASEMLAFVQAPRRIASPTDSTPDDLGGFAARLAALPVGCALRRRPVLRLQAGVPPTLSFLRLGPNPAALAATLGLTEEEDPARVALLRHASDALGRRTLLALGNARSRRDLLGAGPPAPLLLDLPAAALSDAPDPAGAADLPAVLAARPVAIFDMIEAREPEALEAIKRRLHGKGWGIALRGLTAEGLTLLAPERLPADWLALRWSPRLQDRGPGATLRRLDPARLILLGCAEEEALEWGLAQGIALFGGPRIEAVLAAARLSACPAAAHCTRRLCAERAAASGPEGRMGCGNLPLLEAMLPPGFGTLGGPWPDAPRP